MQGAKGEGAGSVLTYVTEPESRKQRRSLLSCKVSSDGTPLSVGGP